MTKTKQNNNNKKKNVFFWRVGVVSVPFHQVLLNEGSEMLKEFRNIKTFVLRSIKDYSCYLTRQSLISKCFWVLR